MFHGSADSVFVMNNKKIKIVFIRERIKPTVCDYQSRGRGYVVGSHVQYVTFIMCIVDLSTAACVNVLCMKNAHVAFNEIRDF